MKTAVIYTGAMRSFARCLPTHRWHLLRHLGDVDFFVSTYKDGTEHEADLLQTLYPNSRVEIKVIDEQPDCVAEMRAKGVSLPAEWHKGRPYTHEPHAISVHPQAVLRQLWQLQNGWELMEHTSKEEYDLIVRCRPDLWFQSSIAVGYEYPAHTAWTPDWGRFGGVNDRFALLGSAAAEGYFHAYQNVPRLAAAGCPIHPESLVLASLSGCEIHQTLRVEFATMRKDGTMRQPEITASDLAHIAAHR